MLVLVEVCVRKKLCISVPIIAVTKDTIAYILQKTIHFNCFSFYMVIEFGLYSRLVFKIP